MKALALLTLLIAAPTAAAGIYQVETYEGNVGTSTVSASLQFVEGGQVTGTYFDKAKREPIALYGMRDAKGAMRLCETRELAAYQNARILAETYKNTKRCPLVLKPSKGGLAGTWAKGRKKEAVQWLRKGRIDTVHDSNAIEGSVMIAFPVKNARHLFVGEYKQEGENRVALDVITVVDKKANELVQKIRFPESYGRVGFQASDFHSNVRNLEGDMSGIEVSYASGGIGGQTGYVFDEELGLYRVDGFAQCRDPSACPTLANEDVLGTWKDTDNVTGRWYFHTNGTMTNDRNTETEWRIEGSRLIAKATNHESNPSIWIFVASEDKKTLYATWFDEAGGNGEFVMKREVN